MFRSQQRVFSDIYRSNQWGDQESRSGSGSNLEQTSTVRERLPVLLAELEVRRMLDLPCGDFWWMSHTKLNLERYIGADLIPELIDDNQRKYGSEIRSFTTLDVMADSLPTVDLILCRDLWVHLSYRNIFKALANFKDSGAEYLLTTTYTEQSKNRDIISGQWRALNLREAPFHFPEPHRIIHEQSTEPNEYEDGKALGKSLGLWRLAELPERARGAL